jgi:uncharacterized membrane protein
MNTFSISETITFGWETFKKRPWFFAAVTALIGIGSSIGSNMTSVFDHMPDVTPIGGGMIVFGVVSVLLGILLSIYLKMGSINFILKAHDNPEAAEVKDLWAPRPLVTYVVTGIVVGVIIVVGLILLIVPGIIWALRYMFAQYIVMDKKLSISEALAESSRITKGHKGQLALFMLALIGINILGALCLIVGLLVSIPVSMLAFAHVYRTLSSRAPVADPIAPSVA